MQTRNLYSKCIGKWCFFRPKKRRKKTNFFLVDAMPLKFKLDLGYGIGQIEFEFRAKIIIFKEVGFFLRHHLFFSGILICEIQNMEIEPKIKSLTHSTPNFWLFGSIARYETRKYTVLGAKLPFQLKFWPCLPQKCRILSNFDVKLSLDVLFSSPEK